MLIVELYLTWIKLLAVVNFAYINPAGSQSFYAPVSSPYSAFLVLWVVCCLFCLQGFKKPQAFVYPSSLNICHISLHLIVSDFARMRQSLKSKCSQVITNQIVYKLIQNIDRSCLLFHKLSSLAKCKVRERTAPKQFVKNKMREMLSDLGYVFTIGMFHYFDVYVGLWDCKPAFLTWELN